MATEAEFKELKDTVASLVKKVDSMSELLAKRLIETVEPLPDEIEATQRYQEDKKNKIIEFIPLEKSQRQ